MVIPELLETANNMQNAGLIQPKVPGDSARRKANGYLTKHVSMFFGAEEPVFFPLAEPVWQVPVIFLRYTIGPVRLGFLDVDATTGEVIPWTDEQIQKIRNRANAFVKYHAL